MAAVNTQSRSRRQLTETVIEQLMEQISSNGLQAGQKLPTEAELIEQFGVSRTVVREALRELNALDIVSLKQGKVTTVSAPTAAPLQNYFKFAVNGRAAGLREGFEIRRALEVEVAGLAAERASDNLLQELDNVTKRMRKSVKIEDQWVRDDLHFHVLIARCAGNQLMLNLVEALSDVIQLGVRTLYEQSDLLDTEETYRRHATLSRAIRSRDSETARAAMIEHFRATEAKVFTMEGRNH